MFEYVNQQQSPETRQAKYCLAALAGLNSSWARRVRDWRETKLQLLLRQLHEAAYDRFFYSMPSRRLEVNVPLILEAVMPSEEHDRFIESLNDFPEAYMEG